MYLKKQHGFSLVELMISLVLGTLVIAMISSLYVSGVVNNINSIKYSRMKTDLQAVMHLMESDIRRAGYRGDTISYAMGTVSGANKFMWLDTFTPAPPIAGVSFAEKSAQVYTHTAGAGANNCILFMYDKDKSGGDPALNEGFGFRLNSQKIEIGSLIPKSSTDCSGGTWQAITDDNFIKITELKFIPKVERPDKSRMRLIQVDLTAKVSIAQETVTEEMSSLIQIRNMEMLR
ncbi:prepilin-type N-terminal cleavage/methylation domain-containing protein [Motilimonas cestriensis]|uniref:Prepilin-type N-terminal cleavage/methylation domain-containing protein n=1 Tax=Motilimonas cestriensis TaxID=2742685 RepID=A0ABS8W8U3_9GAMM|nr:prepilin-type N-terminal cleavage/methylation domain-containing protein [Motilimonas cestriensis]MCE2594690.1 prepilin-type N-terminal cleavage/methylation domain-containing protein [Motilimonas cestriensis]